MRTLTLFVFAMLCLPVLAEDRLLNSYGVETWGVGGFRYIASFSRLYGREDGKFSFEKRASVRGWPEIRVFAASTEDGIDVADLQKRVSGIYEYLREVTGETPPVKRIDIYLVPCGHDFTLAKKSFTFGASARLSFAFSAGARDGCPLDSMGLSREIVRTLAHETMHTILNFHRPDQALNERAAVTIESCAELIAFGDTTFAKRVRLDPAADGQQDAPINVSLRAKYEDDQKLAGISSYGPLSASDAEGANKLFALCRERYQQALRSAR